MDTYTNSNTKINMNIYKVREMYKVHGLVNVNVYVHEHEHEHEREHQPEHVKKHVNLYIFMYIYMYMNINRIMHKDMDVACT